MQRKVIPDIVKVTDILTMTSNGSVSEAAKLLARKNVAAMIVVDENGNLKGFIDYDCKDDFDHQELDKQLNKLRKNKPKRKINRNKKKKYKNDKKLNDVFMTYIIMKETEKENIE